MRGLLSIKALVVLGLAIYVLYEIGGDLLPDFPPVIS